MLHQNYDGGDESAARGDDFCDFTDTRAHAVPQVPRSEERGSPRHWSAFCPFYFSLPLPLFPCSAPKVAPPPSSLAPIVCAADDFALWNVSLESLTSATFRASLLELLHTAYLPARPRTMWRRVKKRLRLDEECWGEAPFLTGNHAYGPLFQGGLGSSSGSLAGGRPRFPSGRHLHTTGAYAHKSGTLLSDAEVVRELLIEDVCSRFFLWFYVDVTRKVIEDGRSLASRSLPRDWIYRHYGILLSLPDCHFGIYPPYCIPAAQARVLSVAEDENKGAGFSPTEPGVHRSTGRYEPVNSPADSLNESSKKVACAPRAACCTKCGVNLSETSAHAALPGLSPDVKVPQLSPRPSQGVRTPASGVAVSSSVHSSSPGASRSIWPVHCPSCSGISYCSQPATDRTPERTASDSPVPIGGSNETSRSPLEHHGELVGSSSFASSYSVGSSAEETGCNKLLSVEVPEAWGVSGACGQSASAYSGSHIAEDALEQLSNARYAPSEEGCGVSGSGGICSESRKSIHTNDQAWVGEGLERGRGKQGDDGLAAEKSHGHRLQEKSEKELQEDMATTTEGSNQRDGGSGVRTLDERLRLVRRAPEQADCVTRLCPCFGQRGQDDDLVVVLSGEEDETDERGLQRLLKRPALPTQQSLGVLRSSESPVMDGRGNRAARAEGLHEKPPTHRHQSLGKDDDVSAMQELRKASPDWQGDRQGTSDRATLETANEVKPSAEKDTDTEEAEEGESRTDQGHPRTFTGGDAVCSGPDHCATGDENESHMAQKGKSATTMEQETEGDILSSRDGESSKSGCERAGPRTRGSNPAREPRGSRAPGRNGRSRSFRRTCQLSRAKDVVTEHTGETLQTSERGMHRQSPRSHLGRNASTEGARRWEESDMVRDATREKQQSCADVLHDPEELTQCTTFGDLLSDHDKEDKQGSRLPEEDVAMVTSTCQGKSGVGGGRGESEVLSAGCRSPERLRGSRSSISPQHDPSREALANCFPGEQSPSLSKTVRMRPSTLETTPLPRQEGCHSVGGTSTPSHVSESSGIPSADEKSACTYRERDETSEASEVVELSVERNASIPPVDPASSVAGSQITPGENLGTATAVFKASATSGTPVSSVFHPFPLDSTPPKRANTETTEANTLLVPLTIPHFSPARPWLFAREARRAERPADSAALAAEVAAIFGGGETVRTTERGGVRKDYVGGKDLFIEELDQTDTRSVRLVRPQEQEEESDSKQKKWPSIAEEPDLSEVRGSNRSRRSSLSPGPVCSNSSHGITSSFQEATTHNEDVSGKARAVQRSRGSPWREPVSSHPPDVFSSETAGDSTIQGQVNSQKATPHNGDEQLISVAWNHRREGPDAAPGGKESLFEARYGLKWRGRRRGIASRVYLREGKNLFNRRKNYFQEIDRRLGEIEEELQSVVTATAPRAGGPLDLPLSWKKSDFYRNDEKQGCVYGQQRDSSSRLGQEWAADNQRRFLSAAASDLVGPESPDTAGKTSASPGKRPQEKARDSDLPVSPLSDNNGLLGAVEGTPDDVSRRTRDGEIAVSGVIGPASSSEAPLQSSASACRASLLRELTPGLATASEMADDRSSCDEVTSGPYECSGVQGRGAEVVATAADPLHGSQRRCRAAAQASCSASATAASQNGGISSGREVSGALTLRTKRKPPPLPRVATLIKRKERVVPSASVKQADSTCRPQRQFRSRSADDIKPKVKALTFPEMQEAPPPGGAPAGTVKGKGTPKIPSLRVGPRRAVM
ncbi:hypothetical protein CSUI_003296 [Cystoisospora suis]|uniref:Uncharacterized protein n=1 Tax=Cystoisospora suis TaxID=483139 RepID=A0A2C6L627_9APIC|nr:hypothetical protein CSUI_003296 [Cystoisospora suis]